MEDQPLGYLERVETASVWKSEAGDFVPWLAAPENLRRLGNAIGLNLEPVMRENPVGIFRADLLCRDRDTGAAVVIQVQLGNSDHRHLGQILTYAFGLGSRAVVWIASRFHPEHRLVLDRINEVGAAELGCFAVEVDLWKIGASPAAPRFTVVAEPRDWPFPVAEWPDRRTAAADDARPRPSDDSPLRAWRKRTGLSIKQLADAAGISRTYLSHIEIGRKQGTPEMRVAIAKALAAADGTDGVGVYDPPPAPPASGRGEGKRESAP